MFHCINRHQNFSLCASQLTSGEIESISGSGDSVCERERETLALTHVIVGLGKSDPAGEAAEWRSREELILQLKPKD